MRIVADPPTMRSAAPTLDDSAAGFSETALRLGGSPIPEMPAWLASATQDLLSDVIPRLRTGADESRLLATELRLRALVAEVGGSGGLNVALREVETLDGDVKPFTASLDIADASGDLAGLLATKGILDATDVAGLAALNEGAGSAEAVSSWVALEQQLSAFTDPAFATDLLAGGTKTASVTAQVAAAAKISWLGGGRVAPILEGASKVVRPFGILANVVIVIGPSQYTNPERDGANRFFAALAVAGLMAGPEGAPLVLIAGAWQVGNLVYDNWPAISREVLTSSRAVWHGYEAVNAKVGELEADGIHKVGDVAGKGYGEGKKLVGDLNPFG